MEAVEAEVEAVEAEVETDSFLNDSPATRAVQRNPPELKGIRPRWVAVLVVSFLCLSFLIFFSQTDAGQSNPASDNEQVSNLVQSVASKPLECIPLACFKEKHFVENPKLLKNGKTFTLLASFPGSGNTWTRAVIEEGTRIWTGSVYNDDELYHSGFLGERMYSFLTAFPRVSAIKTHFPYYLSFKLNPKTKLVISVIRCPLDSLLSEFQRRKSRFKAKDAHTSLASQRQMHEEFPTFFHNAGGAWRKFMSFWMEEDLWTKKRTTHEGGVTSLLLQKTLFDHLPPVPILVLFYEDFVRDFEATSRVLFEFLKTHSLDEAMPDVESSVTCAVHGTQHLNSEKRRHSSEDYNPYLDEEGTISATGLLTQFCEKSKAFWFEEKWGPCEAGQSLKLPRVLPRKLPGVKCET